ncbi:MAG: methyl-accepting chemotaxis protein [Tindallia sp. MSAO_Bac2]|nr:MAG: methyl-accepting chemotaxis protein [Tindallia sp. MSAO_Bac2]
MFKKGTNKKKKRGFSLTFKISVTITLLITVLMIGMGTMTYRMNRNILVQQEMQLSRSLAGLAEEAMAPVLQNGEEAGVMNWLRSMQEDSKIHQAYLTDTTGAITYHENEASIGNRMQTRALDSAMETGLVQVQAVRITDEQPGLLFVAPIHGESRELLGYLHFINDFSAGQQFLDDTAYQWLRIFVATVLVSLFLVRLIIVKSVGKPIKNLLVSAERISTGDFSENLEIDTRDELGQLKEGFNLMNQQLAVLFDSINRSVIELDYSSRMIVSRGEQLETEETVSNPERRQEWIRDIHSNGKRLVRVTGKLQSFLQQFRIEEQA